MQGFEVSLRGHTGLRREIIIVGLVSFLSLWQKYIIDCKLSDLNLSGKLRDLIAMTSNETEILRR